MGHNFKNLKIWQKSMDLTDLVFDFVKDLPDSEKYGLANQMNRCSCSIPSNIAEVQESEQIFILQSFYQPL